MRIFTFYLYFLLNALVIHPPVMAFDQVQQTLQDLKKQLEVLRKRIEQLEKEQIASAKINKHKAQSIKEIPDKLEVEANTRARVYATIRPTFGHIDEAGVSQWDVRDALSHAGFKLNNEFNPGWSAEAQGEWGIDLSNHGDFGKSRRAYVALASPYGRIGIGKQRPPQYLLIAEYLDIFNHASSPFAYDPESLFFVDNLLTYKLKTNDLTWMASSQFDGAIGDENNDLVNLGLSYDKGPLHAAFTYLSQDMRLNGIKTGEDEVIGGALAYKFTPDWYLALGYQDRRYKDDASLLKRNGHTFDMSMAYHLSKILRLKLGYFDFDDGHEHLLSQSFSGYNTTLEWLPDANLRFHLEFLHRDFDYLEDFSSFSLGFRYDFAKEWKY